jgi:5-carboxymethyl-2-hydroxymuconic-semialdehyde dehydrogenase
MQPEAEQAQILAGRSVLHYIAGELTEGEHERFDTLNPATNKPITEVAAAGRATVDQAVAAARAAFDEGSWPSTPATERARVLQQIADGIEEHGAEIVALECLDTGLPITQARGQAARAAENFRFFARQIGQDHTPAFKVGDEFLNYVVRKPVGVAGLITPWNTPFMLETWKVAPCLAAGNTCVLKPAEWSPLSAGKLAEVIDGTDLPAGAFNMVHGIGESAGAALVAHEGVQLISFTGETTTGQEIMRNGADTLKRYSFELGGKSPVVVFADCDFDRAVDAAVFGVFSLNGERCTAGSRLLVERSIYEEFVSAVAARARRIRIGEPFDPQTELGPLIRPEHWARVDGLLAAGRKEGGRFLAGGERPAAWPEGNYIEPTVIADVTQDMTLFQEEVFGPVVVACPFEGEEEAVQLANDVRYGLAGYVWTNDLRRGHRVAEGIDAGMVWVNSQNVRDLRAPFGGAKASGIGREGGEYSFEFYCELETVHVALGEHRIPRFGVGND